MSIELMMPSNHLILCRPLLLLSSIFPSIRVFSSESGLHIRWPSIEASASASLLPVNIQGTGLISLLSKGFSSLLQHHSSKASILWCSVIFMFQLLHTCMTTGRFTALAIQTFIGKVMSLLFNMLSRFVMAFLPRSKCWGPALVDPGNSKQGRRR